MVSLVPIGGNRIIYGGNALCSSSKNSVTVGNPPNEIIEKIAALGFQDYQADTEKGPKVWLSRETYAHTFGPTTGDCIRLGDTCLIAKVERDIGGGKNYGDEVKFGGGKVIRDGMGQSSSHGAV